MFSNIPKNKVFNRLSSDSAPKIRSSQTTGGCVCARVHARVCVCLLGLQNTMNVSAGSTTAMRTRCALTWSEATAAPASRATPATEPCAKVGKGPWQSPMSVWYWYGRGCGWCRVWTPLWRCSFVSVCHWIPFSLHHLPCAFYFDSVWGRLGGVAH